MSELIIFPSLLARVKNRYFPKLMPKLSEILGADLRSLALLRICMGALILIDLIQRSQDLKAHYSDFGVLPRVALLEHMYSRWLISLHVMNGTWQVQALLFAIAGVFALALLLGYKTRVATIVSWVLLVSLNRRNPIILQAGDVELRMILFWGIFLPWGARFSLDSVLSRVSLSSSKPYLSWATFAYLMQISFIYWFGVVFKNGAEWRVEGTAIYYALSLDQFATPLGQFLLQFPVMLKFLTFAVLGFEAIGPLLLFSPLWTGPVRSAVVAGFFFMHLGFGACLAIGLFTFIGALSPLGLLPSWFWENLKSRLRKVKNGKFMIYYDQDCGFCETSVRIVQGLFPREQITILPANQDESANADMLKYNSWVVVDEKEQRYFRFAAVVALVKQSPLFWRLGWVLDQAWVKCWGEKMYVFVANHRQAACRVDNGVEMKIPPNSKLGKTTGALVAVSFLYVFAWNLSTLPSPPFRLNERFRILGEMFGLEQRWDMFSPYPLKEDGWYVIPGALVNGSTVDLFRNGSDVTWRKPNRVSRTYKNYRWRKYMMNLWSRRNAKYRVNYAQYLCSEWNARNRGVRRLEELEIYFLRELTLPDYDYSTPEKIMLLQYRCADAKSVTANR